MSTTTSEMPALSLREFLDKVERDSRRLDELERENARMREALKPFAAQTRVSSLTEEKMIRAARAALAGSGEK
jgi:cell shape-determining protein MreC